MMQSYHSKRGETKRTKKARIVPQQRRQCRPTYIPVAVRLLANCYTPFTFYLYLCEQDDRLICRINSKSADDLRGIFRP